MHVRRHLAVLLALLLALLGTALVAPTATAAAGSGVLLPGETLRAGEGLTVRAARLAADLDLDMQADGNLVLYHDHGGFRVAEWSTRTEGNPGAHVTMQGDGNLVLYAADGRPLWHTRTHGRPGASLTLQSDGDLVVHAGGTAVWRSGTTVVLNALGSGERLLPGQDLVSPDGRYRFVMQGDGNFVGYDEHARPIFWTGTHGNPGGSLVMQGDGNLVLYAADGRPLWWTGTHGTGAGLLHLWAGGSLTVLVFTPGGVTAVWAFRGPGPAPEGDV